MQNKLVIENPYSQLITLSALGIGTIFSDTRSGKILQKTASKTIHDHETAQNNNQTLWNKAVKEFDLLDAEQLYQALFLSQKYGFHKAINYILNITKTK